MAYRRTCRLEVVLRALKFTRQIAEQLHQMKQACEEWPGHGGSPESRHSTNPVVEDLAQYLRLDSHAARHWPGSP